MRYRFYRDAEGCCGAQSFIVEASNMSEAKENLDNSEFECDETEITELGEPYGFHEDESAETMEEREAKEHGEITRLAAELKKSRCCGNCGDFRKVRYGFECGLTATPIYGMVPCSHWRPRKRGNNEGNFIQGAEDRRGE